MTPNTANFDQRYFRSVVGRFPTGVTAITTESPDDQTPLGLTISSFHSLSLDPPLILWTLTKAASTLTHFRNAHRYVVHILGAEQERLAMRFAHGPQPERFKGLALTRAPGGTLMLDDSRCAAWLECFNVTQHDAGDHYLFIGQVEHCYYQSIAPLVYHSGGFELTPDTYTVSDHADDAIPL